MTGLQEHPGTGRTLDHCPTNKLRFEELIRGIGVARVHTLDAMRDPAAFKQLLQDTLAARTTAVIIARRPCTLAAPRIMQYEKAAAECEDG
jgi:indolepyruvate ferredoxin oxidoreductase alpha subunit